MKIDKKLLIVCLVVPLAVGGIAALLTGGGMDTFETLSKPPLSPPGWLFPVVWTILYILMGVASYLVLTSGAARTDISRAILVDLRSARLHRLLCIQHEGQLLIFNFQRTHALHRRDLVFRDDHSHLVAPIADVAVEKISVRRILMGGIH